MTKLVGSIDHDSAFCAVEDAIPCIMHGGVRMNEKLFMLVLLEAWESCETNAEREALIPTLEIISILVFLGQRSHEPSGNCRHQRNQS